MHGLVDEPLAVDVGVVHILQLSNLDVQPGHPAKKMERHKLPEPVVCAVRHGDNWRVGRQGLLFAGDSLGEQQWLQQQTRRILVDHGCNCAGPRTGKTVRAGFSTSTAPP